MAYSMNNRDEIFDTLCDVLVEMFEADRADISMEARLYEDLDIDSIDAIDLVVKVKDITGKRVKPEDFKAVRTVGDVVIAIERLLGI
ncbi:acyl carrier protein [Porticoccus sp. W117]|uniref:acyl carrier protein n=1 Tax=Porticoccus sp. W117 TaxID=3054777 RepID=UPI0025968170|nr:acyl carrier protein [Porticoccus sp. W117]MDM3869857.1 acyl carrier protein [Porticoccus sp. W117]